VTLRLIGRGRVNALWVLCGVVAVVAVALLATPLGQVINARMHASNTSTRQTLYQSSLAIVHQSPVLGYGSPVSSAGIYNSNDASVGTHGQFWTVLVSQGYPGAVLFVGFLVLMILLTWRVSDHGLWLHAVLIVALVQLPFYDPLPVGFCLTFACIALCLRDVGNQRRRAPLNPLIVNTRGAP